MTNSSVFYFVNADGSGHTRRAEAIVPYLSMPVVIASEQPSLFRGSRGQVSFCCFPPLRADGDRQLADDALHIPYGHGRIYLERVKCVVEQCRQHHCTLAVIDVCAETAMTMRLCGIPYLYMRMSGKRNDTAHLQSYRAAAGLIASYPEAFEEDWVPDWMKQKTCYVGGIVSPQPTPTSNYCVAHHPYVLVMRGKGTSQITTAAIASAAASIPDYYWIGIGFEKPQVGQNFEVFSYVADPGLYLQHAAIVIGNTGNNSVLEVGLYARPFITLPEWRFFDEQVAKAAMLEKYELAVVLTEWPQTVEAWQTILSQTTHLQTQTWSGIVSDDGARQAADYIMHQFERFSTQIE